MSKVSTPSDKLHHHELCDTVGCCSLSRLEAERQKLMKYKFKHSWLMDTKSYCNQTEVWWPVFVEGQGLYCLLCTKQDTENPQNKKKIFNEEPSTRFRPEALSDHIGTKQHRDAVTTELTQRVSCFQKQLDHQENVKDDALVKVFTSI